MISGQHHTIFLLIIFFFFKESIIYQPYNCDLTDLSMVLHTELDQLVQLSIEHQFSLTKTSITGQTKKKGQQLANRTFFGYWTLKLWINNIRLNNTSSYIENVVGYLDLSYPVG